MNAIRSTFQTFFTFLFALSALVLCTAREARADGTLRMRWDTRATIASDNCEALSPLNGGPRALYDDCKQLHWDAKKLPVDGYGHIIVAGTPRPTYVVPGKYKPLSHTYPAPYSSTTFSALNTFAAEFPVDVVTAQTTFLTVKFDYGDLKPISNSRDQITLETASGDVPVMMLLKGRRYWTPDGLPGDGAPTVSLVPGGGDMRDDYCSIFLVDFSPECMHRIRYRYAGNDDPQQDGQSVPFDGIQVNVPVSRNVVNPNFDKSVKEFNAAIKAAQGELLANADKLADFDAKMDELTRLSDSVDALLQSGLENVTPDAMDALLKDFPSLPESVRNATVDLIRDLKKTLVELQDDLNRVAKTFGDQMNTVIDLIYQNLNSTGFDPKDPASYRLIEHLGDVPDVTLPDVGGTTWDPKNDIYATDADATLKTLRGFVVGASVPSDKRTAFAFEVRRWQERQRTIQKWVTTRATPKAEYDAFLIARNRVVDFLRSYLDAQGWFLDSPLPPHVKEVVDGVYVRVLGSSRADGLKEALNIWSGGVLSPQEDLLAATVAGLGQGIADLVTYGELTVDALDEFGRTVDDIKWAVTRVGLGFVPVLGPAIDICEALKGRELCRAEGRVLSDQERAIAGFSGALGAVTFWGGVAKAGTVGAEGVAFAGLMGRLRRLNELRRDLRIDLLRSLGTVLQHLDDVPASEVARLAKKLGDLPVIQLGTRLGGNGLQKLEGLEKLDYFIVKFDQATQQAIKSRGAAVKSLPPLAGKTAPEIRTVLQQKGFTLNPATTARQEAWTHADGSVIRMAPTGAGDFRPGPNLKKEISAIAGSIDEKDILCKVTEAGFAAPAGTRQAKEFMTQWLRTEIGGGVPTPGEAEGLLQVWGDFTHIEYVP